MPWIERCLESIAGYPTIVVDHGSTDGTLELVRERFPQATLIEQENKGFGAGLNRGMRSAPDARYYLLINSDAWVVGDAVERLERFADENPRVAVVGPRLRYPDGSLQRSVRGFPTLWRLATEYLFLRKLAPRSSALNAFYAGGFEHDRTREAEFLMAACYLVRREATDEVGLFDERYFMFSEEVDWCYRFHQAGWGVVFFPGAEVVHVGGASWEKEFDPMFREQVRGHLRFLADHKGMTEAERARLLFLAGLNLRAWFFPKERRATYRNAAEWLSSGSVESLLQDADLPAHRCALSVVEAMESAGVEQQPEARADARVTQRGHVTVHDVHLDPILAARSRARPRAFSTMSRPVTTQPRFASRTPQTPLPVPMSSAVP